MAINPIVRPKIVPGRAVLSLPQSRVHVSKAKFVACVAGLGSGKTYVIALKMLHDYFSYPGAHICYLAPTYSLISDIIYPLLEEFLTLTKTPYSLNKTDAVLTVPGYGRMFFRSMTKPEKIIGFSIMNAYLDEIDTIPETQADLVVDKILARTRQKIHGKRNQIYIISSPEGFGYMYNNFDDENGNVPIEDSQLIRMTTYDNAANLPEDYIPSMQKKYSQSLIDAYLSGKFVNINALGVWPDFDRNLNYSPEQAYADEMLFVGQDFNVGRGCAVIHVARDNKLRVIQNPKEGNLHAIDEIHSMVDTPATIKEIKDKYPNHPVTVIPDASGKSRKSTNFTESDHKLLKAAGFKVRAHNKNPVVKNRVSAANARFCNGLGERRYFVNFHKCPIYVNALEKQVYDPKDNMPKKDGKLDDITDAGTYPIEYYYPIIKGYVGTGKTEGH